MKTHKYLIIMVLLWAVFVGLNLFAFTELHEQAHARIYITYGYENVTVYNLGLSGFITADETEYSQTEAADSYHVLNEIVGYHFLAFIVSLWVMIMFILVVVVIYGEFKSNRN